MPTTRRRHSITETDAVERALEPLRARGVEVDFGELVTLGAAAKAEQLDAAVDDEQRRAELRARFLERTSTGAGIDVDALVEAREQGWTHGP